MVTLVNSDGDENAAVIVNEAKNNRYTVAFYCERINRLALRHAVKVKESPSVDEPPYIKLGFPETLVDENPVKTE